MRIRQGSDFPLLQQLPGDFVASIHRDLRSPGHSYYWTENAKKLRSFRLMDSQGLGALPDLRRSLDRWWDLIYEPCRHAVAARDSGRWLGRFFLALRPAPAFVVVLL